MSSIWNAILDGFESMLRFFHGILDPIFPVNGWGWAIILLTIVVRVALLPLAVKQTRSMRAMQELAPQIKKIQKKYPTDRTMMREDPEKYRARKAKVNEETMALYREAGVNPAGGCLPLIAQMPIFFALFSVLRGSAEIRDQPFYFFTSGLEAGVNEAGETLATGLVLILLMAATMFVSQKQTMARTNAEGPAAQQQKIMLYVMPAMLGFFGLNLPLGVLLYWVTTNVWQMGQQYVIYREVNPTPAARDDDRRDAAGSTPSDGRSTKSPKASGAASRDGAGAGKKSGTSKTSSKKAGKHDAGTTRPSKATSGAADSSSHVPKRSRRGRD